MSLVPGSASWPEPFPRRVSSTFGGSSRQLRSALQTTEEQAVEVAHRNGLLTELASQAVRNIHRYAREVQSLASDSMYVATAADTYFLDLLEGQDEQLRRYRRGC